VVVVATCLPFAAGAGFVGVLGFVTVFAMLLLLRFGLHYLNDAAHGRAQ
jgi:hypothetical protein